MKLLRRFLAPLLAFLVALAPAQPQLSLPIAPATVLAVSAVTAAINFTPLSAGALTPAEKPVILGGIQSWSFPGSSADLYFARNAGSCAINRLLKPCASLLTTTRASTGYAQWADGHLSSFAANVPRITDLGLLVEQAATNVVLWNRDLTNAAWTKSNITAALNQTGADGTANAATSLTATAGNGTCLQAITLASSARFQSAWVKRITGTGTINMTMDNGVTWTAITVTAAYAQLTIPTQTLANPTVGFRIVTSGDAIAVDLVGNETGTIATSPIATTTVAVTRAADSISLTIAASNLIPITTATLLFNMGAVPWGNDGADHILLAFLQSGSTPGVGKFSGGTIAFNDGVGYRTSQTYTNGAAFKYAVAYGGTAVNSSLNGGTVSNYASYAGSIAGTGKPFKIGSGSGSAYWNGTFKRITVFPTVLDPVSVSALP